MLARVTNALASLLELNVTRLQGSSVTVTKLPPEQADSPTDPQLNLFLYHSAYDGDGGNDFPLGPSGDVPIATRPLALKLYYVMTAHSNTTDGVIVDIEDQQTLMGWGMKTLHDFPVVADNTMVGTIPLFIDPNHPLGDRKIEVALRPITPEETVSFWSTDQVRTARLAAFYEVRTVLLPVEEPTMTSGPVSGVALAVRGSGPPSLEFSTSRQSFDLPDRLGGQSMTVERRPAVAALQAGIPGAESSVKIIGLALGTGLDALFVFRAPFLPEGMAVFSAADNANWQISVTDPMIVMIIHPVVNIIRNNAVQPTNLLPGLYSFALRRNIVTTTESGIERSVDSESNQIVIALAPYILSVAINASDHVIVTVDAAYDVGDANAEARLSIAGDVYQPTAIFAGDASDEGRFIARDGNIYDAVPLAGQIVAGQTYQVKLTVNGVDSQPYWLEA